MGSTKKPDDTGQLIFKNQNSFIQLTENNRDKIHTIDDTHEWFNADVLARCEAQMD